MAYQDYKIKNGNWNILQSSLVDNFGSEDISEGNRIGTTYYISELGSIVRHFGEDQIRIWDKKGEENYTSAKLEERARIKLTKIEK